MIKNEGEGILENPETKLRGFFRMNYPAAELRGIKNNMSIPLMVSFRQSLSRNPVPYEKTLDSRSKDCGNDGQRIR